MKKTKDLLGFSEKIKERIINFPRPPTYEEKRNPYYLENKISSGIYYVTYCIVSLTILYLAYKNSLKYISEINNQKQHEIIIEGKIKGMGDLAGLVLAEKLQESGYKDMIQRLKENQEKINRN